MERDMDQDKDRNVDEYFAKLDLKSEDLSLHILVCSTSPLPFLKKLKNLQYIDQDQLLKLPFSDQFFDLAICAEVLFVEREKEAESGKALNLTEGNHIEAILELARVATEVRIYPVTKRDGNPSRYLGPVIQALQLKGLGVELREVKASGERNGQALLRLWRESCMLKDSSQKMANNSN